MEPIIKETQVIRDHDGGWDRNTSSRSKWALGLGIFGAAAGGLALARQGGIGGIVGTGAAPSNTVVYTGPATCPATATPIWDEIDAITGNMSQAEFKAMEADENYQKSLEALMTYVAAVQLQMIRPHIEGSPEGKKLLEQHLTNVKFLRKAALDDVNKKMADFEDYTKNYSHMSWEEYLKTKGGKKK